MRATLVEVLGGERGDGLYTDAWLRDRAASHVDGRLPGAIFLARCEAGGAPVGHVIVREERDDTGVLGLVSTIYVRPEARRRGVARRLLAAAHDWFGSRGLRRRATDTAATNVPLIGLLEEEGYRVVFRSDDRGMVRLMRSESFD